MLPTGIVLSNIFAPKLMPKNAAHIYDTQNAVSLRFETPLLYSSFQNTMLGRKLGFETPSLHFYLYSIYITRVMPENAFYVGSPQPW